MADERDGVEIIWAYRPDDRSKQDTSEWLPADVAKMKVQEGLARYPRDGEGSQAQADDDGAGDAEAAGDAVADVEVDEAETVPPETVVTDARTKRSTKTAPVPAES